MRRKGSGWNSDDVGSSRVIFLCKVSFQHETLICKKISLLLYHQMCSSQ